MRAFLLASLFMGLPLASGNLKVSNWTQFWAESGISREMVQVTISNATCFSSPSYLEACRGALKEAQRALDLNHPEPLVEDDFNSALDRVEKSSDRNKPKELIFGNMYNRFLHAFDPHALLLPESAFESWTGAETDPHYGAGIYVMATDAGVFVRRVVPNSPAARAGFKVHDKILRVGDHDIGHGVEGSRNSDLLKGQQPGDVLQVTIERAGHTKHILLTIGIVNEESIDLEPVHFNRRPYLYVRLGQFKTGSCEKLKKRILSEKDPYQGLILDLRDNPGGLRDQGICAASLFVGPKDILGQKFVPVRLPINVGFVPQVTGEVEWEKPGDLPAVFNKVPVVLLINSGTASSAEILAGALQDYKVAWVVGERSFGKGTVQTFRRMPGAKGFRIGFTAAMFFRPNGNSNQLTGVVPNFEVPFRHQASPEERRFPREGDFFPNTLKPESAEVGEWKETRGEEVSSLRKCVEGTKSQARASSLLQARLGFEDFQMAYSLALLHCVNKPSVPGPANVRQ